LPLLMLVGVAGLLWVRHGSVTHFSLCNVWPTWNWDTVNFWSQIAFAFTGLELVSCMSAEVRDPQRTLSRAVYGAGALIAAMYIVGTLAVLVLVPAGEVSVTSGVFHAITAGSIALKVGFFGILAAVLVTVGNAGGVGSTVAGIARVPFVVGIDQYLPRAFGKIHPHWKTPYVSILVQAIISGLILLVSQINQSTRDSYQQLVDAAIILYFIPFLYMFAAAIWLSRRRDRTENDRAVLIPGGLPGVWITSGVAFFITLVSIVLSVFPPGESSNRTSFLFRTLLWVVAALAVGLTLYWRGLRAKQEAHSA